MYSPKDNPFAKGVSINQDIVQEPVDPISAHLEILDREVLNDIVIPELIRQFGTKCIGGNRELLALGREEE